MMPTLPQGFMITSQIKSHLEYLIQTYDNFVVETDEKSSLNGGF